MVDPSQALTPRQTETLAFVNRYVSKHGVPPTVREVAAALGLASTNAAAQLLDQLVRRGVIRKVSRRSRGIRVGHQAGTTTGIPILGRIAAGQPIYAAENLEGTMSPDPFLVGDPERTFALRVEGDSMIGDGILPGDYIFVRRQPVAERGQIVVALLDDEATVKRYFPDGTDFLLVASNPAYAPIKVDPSRTRFELLGVVTGVFRKMN
jgi:repressor LexA